MDQQSDTAPTYKGQTSEFTTPPTTSGRLTPARQTVIDILKATRQALTHHEIERQARASGVRFDRVTLYRALDWLVVNGIAHKVAAEDRVWRFNAARSNGREQIHFQCTSCATVHCLDTPEQAITMHAPAGFRIERTEIMLRGTCASCGS